MAVDEINKLAKEVSKFVSGIRRGRCAECKKVEVLQYCKERKIKPYLLTKVLNTSVL